MTSNTEQDDPPVELTTFSCSECGVYSPIPPASSIGHRAELWNVDKWLQEVKLKVVTCGDNLYIRLDDATSGDLFAECPVPNNAPVATVCEPVIDSSRYFVLKIVDRATKHHAFVGVGFRQRNDASDFNAALDSHKQYLRRQQQAEQMKAEYEAKEEGPAGPTTDYSLKGTIKLGSLPQKLRKTSSVEKTPSDPVPLLSAIPKLAPPPSGPLGSFARNLSGVPVNDEPAAEPSATPQSSTGAPGTAAQTVVGADKVAAVAGEGELDDWGDFVG